MKINWGFSPLWRENLKRIAIQCEKLSAKPHSKPPFLPFLSLFPFESESDNGYYILLRSLTFFPSQIAGCYVNVSQNTPRRLPATGITGCFHELCIYVTYFVLNNLSYLYTYEVSEHPKLLFEFPVPRR